MRLMPNATGIGPALTNYRRAWSMRRSLPATARCSRAEGGARPIPIAPPVTSATLFESRFIC